MKTKPLNRRSFLKAGSSLILLPMFESLIPFRAGAASTFAGAPIRVGFMHFPYGVYYGDWIPTGSLGASYTLPTHLNSLTPYRSDLIMHKQLWQPFGRVDGEGSHARDHGTFLCCARLNKSMDIIRAGISVDQVIANMLSGSTPVKSVVMSRNNFGGADSGYSSYYEKTLSWSSATQATRRVNNPGEAFDLLFSGSSNPQQSQTEAAKRAANKKSILDSTMESINQVTTQLGQSDKQKLDQYLTSIREVEKKITALPPPARNCNKGTKPLSVVDFPTHIRLMMDLMVLAYQCDLTRVISNSLGSASKFNFLNIFDLHHATSHWSSDKSFPEKYRKTTTWYAEQFAYFLKRMKETIDVNGKSLLDNSMIIMGSGLNMQGTGHYHDNLPIILAGKAGGQIQSGRSMDAGKKVKLANLYLAMLKIMGYTESSFGDSDGEVNLK